MKTLEATVVKHTGSHYLLSSLPEWAPFPATIRGKVRLLKSGSTNPIAVGDKVSYELDGQGQATITGVSPRRNYLIRRSTNLSRESHIIASNIDRCFIVVTLALPQVPLQFLDRMLVTCGLYGVDVTIVLNKYDLLEEADYFHEIYSGAGYEVIDVSARTGHGIADLRKSMSAGINLFSGMSGVGKSSLIKALDPSLDPRTGDISSAHLQGRHTTTFYEMYPVQSGGFIIDTPGIRSFGLVDIEPDEIARYFPEMLRESTACRYMPCTHTHEPHCAVREAIDDGRISPERYASYLGMLEESGKYR